MARWSDVVIMYERGATTWQAVSLPVAIVVWLTPAAWAVKVSIPAMEGGAGESVDIPIMIDQVDNLSGVRLVLDYDANILTFKKGAKSKQTRSLMHIINDRKPGRLIIVMAGSRGIKGKHFAMLTLQFVIEKTLKEKKTVLFRIAGVELTTGESEAIKAEIKVNPFTVLPPKNRPRPRKKFRPSFIDCFIAEPVLNENLVVSRSAIEGRPLEGVRQGRGRE